MNKIDCFSEQEFEADTDDSFMAMDSGISDIVKLASNATVHTEWGFVNTEAKYSNETGLCYFKAASGFWINYEPNQVAECILNG